MADAAVEQNLEQTLSPQKEVSLIGNAFGFYSGFFAKYKVPSQYQQVLEMYDKVLQADLGLGVLGEPTGKDFEKKKAEHRESFFGKMGISTDALSEKHPLNSKDYIELVEKAADNFKALGVNYDILENVKKDVALLGKEPDAFFRMKTELELLEGIYSDQPAYLEEIIKKFAGETGRKEHWRDVNYKELNIKKILGKFGLAGRTNPDLVKALIYGQLRGEVPKWLAYYKNLITAKEGEVLTTTNLKDKVLLGSDGKLNYYAVRKLIRMGILERLDTGKYIVHKLNIHDEKSLANLANGFRDMVNQFSTAYGEAIRNTDLLSPKMQEKYSNKELLEVYRKALNTVMQSVTTPMPITFADLNDRIVRLDEMLPKWKEEVERGLAKFGNKSADSKSYLRYVSNFKNRTNKMFGKSGKMLHI